MTVFMGSANVSREYLLDGSIAHMNCLHPTHFSAGSRVPPSLPRGIPIRTGTDIKGGTIAGIVLGVVVAIFLSGIGVVRTVIRRRRRRRAQWEHDYHLQELANNPSKHAEILGNPISEVLSGEAAKEMPVHEPAVAELDGD